MHTAMHTAMYTASAKARSFVPYYAQRLSTACVMHGASAIQRSLVYFGYLSYSHD